MIFHLSFPVVDIDEALAFYENELDGVVGRREKDWLDVALFGAQLTLQHRPAEVTSPMPRSRHFGVTWSWTDWEALSTRITQFVEKPRVDYAGTDREQAKAMVKYPSGNLIEIKAYRNPRAVLGSLGKRLEA